MVAGDRRTGSASDLRWSPVTGVGVRRAAEAVGETLAALGVRHAFGLIGSGNFLVTNALVAAGVDFLSARHECAAIVMADLAHAAAIRITAAASGAPGR